MLLNARASWESRRFSFPRQFADAVCVDIRSLLSDAGYGRHGLPGEIDSRQEHNKQ